MVRMPMELQTLQRKPPLVESHEHIPWVDLRHPWQQVQNENAGTILVGYGNLELADMS